MSQSTRSRWRRAVKWLTVAIAAGALAFGLVYAWVGAEVAAGFPAKMMCSCLFVERRDLDGCRAEVALQGFGWVVLSPDWKRRAVEARALRLRRARAEYRDGAGCVLR